MQQVIGTVEGRQCTLNWNAEGYVDATRLCIDSDRVWARYRRAAATDQYLAFLHLDTGVLVTQLTKMSTGRHMWVHHKVATHLAQWISPALGAWMTRMVEQHISTTTLQPVQPVVEIGTPYIYFVMVPWHFTGVTSDTASAAAADQAPRAMGKIGKSDKFGDRWRTHTGNYRGAVQVVHVVAVSNATLAETELKRLCKLEGLLFSGVHAVRGARDTELVPGELEHRSRIIELMEQAAAPYPAATSSLLERQRLKTAVEQEVLAQQQARLQAAITAGIVDEQSAQFQIQQAMAAAAGPPSPPLSEVETPPAKRAYRHASKSTKGHPVPAMLQACVPHDIDQETADRYTTELRTVYDQATPTDIPFSRVEVWLELCVDVAVAHCDKKTALKKNPGSGFNFRSAFSSVCKKIGKPQLAKRFTGTVRRGRPRKV